MTVSPLDQLLLTLRFYTTGSFKNVLGDFCGLHKTTAGTIIRRVSTAIAALRCRCICMPRNNDENVEVQYQFYEIAQFPRVIGAIDCTYMKIQNLGGENGELFRNRKGYFSLNVQAVRDSNYKFRDVVCRWPGSAHDSHILRNSNIYLRMENNEMGNLVLLGDSGYPLKKYLITPILNAVTATENLFNNAQIRTRTIIERTFRIWKRRFPVLSLGMRNKINTIQNIIIATVV